MHKALIIISLFTLSFSGNAQIVLATETFGSGSAQGTLANGFAGDMGNWTVTNTGANGGSANVWYVSGEECGNAAGTCGSACSLGDNSLHVSAIGGLCGGADCGAAYDESGLANETNKRAESPTVDCTNQYFIELNFNYIAAQGDDGFWVEYSTNNGTTWTTFTGGNVAASQCCSCLDAFFCGFGICCPPQIQQSCALGGQGYWTAVNLSFPATADNNNQVKFAFHWSNDGDGIGTDPSVAIDDITVTYATSLPIELTNLSVEESSVGNVIFWNTLSEVNSSHFILEHSIDGQSFRAVETIDAAQESSLELDYHVLHKSNYEDNYYRIKVVDQNGEYDYSQTIYLRNEMSDIGISQNESFFTITGLSNYSGNVAVYDLTGKNVYPSLDFALDTDVIDLDLIDLNEGLYIIQIITGNGKKQFKVKR